MNYPLYIDFKKIALASQYSIVDANGNMIAYVKQKLFKLKEDIKVHSDRKQTNLLYSIRADRIIDFSAKYTFYDTNERPIGAIKRKGARSLWRANYLIDSDNETFTINEDSVFVRFMDSFLGCCAGLFFHPSYTVTREDGTPIMKIKKMASLFESKFKIEKIGNMTPNEETQTLLGAMLLLLLERARG